MAIFLKGSDSVRIDKALQRLEDGIREGTTKREDLEDALQKVAELRRLIRQADDLLDHIEAMSR